MRFVGSSMNSVHEPGPGLSTGIFRHALVWLDVGMWLLAFPYTVPFTSYMCLGAGVC